MQTEHHEAPDADYIETQVFRDGEILLSRRFRRRRDLEGQPKRDLAAQLRQIHQNVVEKLRAGQLRRSEQPARTASDDRQLRKIAIRFLRAVGDRAPADDLRKRLVSAANIMALIGGQHTSWSLRNEDLTQLLRFRDETMDLLRARDVEREAALDLWRRLAATASRLARVNERRSLIEHDIARCRQALEALDAARGSGALTRGERRELRSLWGRDRALDRLLDEPGTLTVASARGPLARVLGGLESRA
ncbi:MAG: hypothetical protein AAGF23_06385 [Acidobacteriota bacterium]